MSSYPPQSDSRVPLSGTPGEPPLDEPYYGAPIKAAASRFFQKYTTFSGRASRSEFWWWALISFVVGTVLGAISSALGWGGNYMAGWDTFGPGGDGANTLSSLWSLATIIPWLALAWRRLHDTGRSGWWMLMGLIPIAGPIILIVFFASATNPAGAMYDRARAVPVG